MVLPSSGAVAFSTVASEFSIFSFYGATNVGSTYFGKVYYRADGGFVFPSSAFAFSRFYGTSPDDEWNCQCANCVCGK